MSEGEGGFRDHADTGDPAHEHRGEGEVESTLTSVHPYVRLEASERLSLWGVLGYGVGELTLTVGGSESGPAPRQRLTTDTSMEMAAAGARGVLAAVPETDGVELAVRTDALLVRMRSDAVQGGEGGGNLAATTAESSRLRFLFEGSRRSAVGASGALTPSFEAGLRHDGGDAETGFGLELGAGLRYTEPGSGLTVEAKLRGLVAHQDADYREWGASGGIRIDPGASGRGLSLSVAPAWGEATNGAERLWSLADARGLGNPGAFEPSLRLDTEAGYGLRGFAGRGLTTPYAGLGLSETGGRVLRAGVRWTVGTAASLGLEATRREPADEGAAGHDIEVGVRLRW